jgi:hypothetical protein
VTDADAQGDAEAFDCDACPVAEQLGALAEDPENQRAWAIYHRVATRFNADTHAGGVVLAGLTAGWDREDFQDVVERLAVIYDVLSPPPEPSR